MNKSAVVPHTKPSILFTAMRAYIVVAVVYVLLIFILPANTDTMHRYHLSPNEYKFLYFAVVLPSIGVWFAAFYGYARLAQYYSRIAESTEGRSFQLLTRGLFWLTLSLPLPSLVSIVLNAVGNKHPGLHTTNIIVVNYINLVLPLIAFIIVSRAARSLPTKRRTLPSATMSQAMIIVYITASVIYGYITFQHLGNASLSATSNAFFLPVWLLIASIMIPYLFTWFIGLLASYEIISYSKATQGLLYRKPLQLLVGGLVAVLAGLIALQYLNSIEPAAGHLQLNSKLLLSTIFRIVGGIGFILIASGADRLKRIEDI